MNKIGKIAIIVALMAGIVIAVAVRRDNSTSQIPDITIGNGLPVMIDLGAGTCIPCKLMAPILEDLKKEFKGSITIEFLDLNKNPEFAKLYNINVMPTQIFFDASGKELSRHEGFFSKEDILAKMKELKILSAE
jgi:thioredoxin 1